jgi:hypothetical protein
MDAPKVYPCPFPPEWYAGQVSTRRLPLMVVVERWLEVEAGLLERIYAGGGRLGPNEFAGVWWERFACGHAEYTGRPPVKKRRCCWCGLAASVQ